MYINRKQTVQQLIIINLKYVLIFIILHKDIEKYLMINVQEVLIGVH